MMYGLGRPEKILPHRSGPSPFQQDAMPNIRSRMNSAVMGPFMQPNYGIPQQANQPMAPPQAQPPAVQPPFPGGLRIPPGGLGSLLRNLALR